MTKPPRPPRYNAFRARDEEIARLRAEVLSLRSVKFAEAFAKELGRNVVLLMATTERKDWPRMAEIAFRHTREQTPTSAEIWLSGCKKV